MGFGALAGRGLLNLPYQYFYLGFFGRRLEDFQNHECDHHGDGGGGCQRRI
jgi:hypothetical protein